MDFAGRLLELTKDKDVQEMTMEAARTMFQNQDINVDPTRAVMSLLLLLFIPLFLLYLRFPLLESEDSNAYETRYEPASYGAPVASDYEAPPSSSYGVPAYGFADEYRSLSNSLNVANEQPGLKNQLAAAL